QRVLYYHSPSISPFAWVRAHSLPGLTVYGDEKAWWTGLVEWASNYFHLIDAAFRSLPEPPEGMRRMISLEGSGERVFLRDKGVPHFTPPPEVPVPSLYWEPSLFGDDPSDAVPGPVHAWPANQKGSMFEPKLLYPDVYLLPGPRDGDA